MGKAIFITATDTDAGKTVSMYALALMLKAKGLTVGVFKPVQCAGEDAEFLKDNLRLVDDLRTINPFFAEEPLSPNVAFQRANREVCIEKIKDKFYELKEKYDVLLVEGAGGLLVPIKDQYLVADLIQDLECDAVIVSRLGLGAINHTLLTVQAAQSRGIQVKGVILNNIDGCNGVSEQTNPDVIAQHCDVPVLGVLPHFHQ